MDIRSYLAAGVAIAALAAPAGAQSAQTQTTTTTSTATPQDPATTTVGTSGQSQPSPMPQAVPAPMIRPAYWTANAGYETDTHNTGYAFAGPQYVHPIRPNVAWVAGANANYLYYEYPLADGVTHVAAPGFTARGGVLLGDRNYVQLSAGPTWKRRYMENRDVFGATRSKTHDMVTGMGVGIDASVNPTSHSNLFGLYDFNSSDSYQWARLAYKEQISNRSWSGSLAHFVGVEGIGQGNDDIHSTQFGAFWETAFVPAHVSLMVRGGWKRSTFPLGGEDQTGPWFAIGFWHRIR